MKTINKKNYLIRSAIVFTCYFIITSFITRSVENTFSDTVVKVEQENDGLTVSVKTSKNINIKFYMFNAEGILVKELNIYGSKKLSITQLEKGIYIYDFFSNDERIKAGKIELK